MHTQCLTTGDPWGYVVALRSIKCDPRFKFSSFFPHYDSYSFSHFQHVRFLHIFIQYTWSSFVSLACSSSWYLLVDVRHYGTGLWSEVKVRNINLCFWCCLEPLQCMTLPTQTAHFKKEFLSSDHKQMSFTGDKTGLDNDFFFFQERKIYLYYNINNNN